MASVSDDLQKVLDGRDPAQVAITIEAKPGKGDAVRDELDDLGVRYTSVNVRNKTVFDATVARDQLTVVRSSGSVAVLDHSPTFSPLGARAPQPDDEPDFGLASAVAAEDITRTPMAEVMEKLNVPEAWDRLGNRGEGVAIGMVDTPIDDGHPALRDSIAGTEANAGQELHGSWVASAAVASPFETGRGEVYGAAPDADLYAHGALSGGGASLTEIAEGIEYCIEEGCDVINVSFGGQHSDVLQSVVKEATDAGCMVVSSSGNSGPAPRTVTCPAHHTFTTTVASVSTAENDPAAFSSRGPGFGGRPKPDLSAYGGHSILQGGQQVVTEVILGAAPGGGADYLVGTSMASPQCAGIAALSVAAEESR
jgi:subtilisin family serine protease